MSDVGIDFTSAVLAAHPPKDILNQIDALECEESLAVFIERAWPMIDPAQFLSNWHIDAIAEHLEAVSGGQIRRLVINVPPRTGKSAIVSTLWPAWTWAHKREGALLGPQVRFLCLSYGLTLALDAARAMRRLIDSPWYCERWGGQVVIAEDQDTKDDYGTTMRGHRITAGFGGSVLGRGGDIRIIDDPHKPDEVESALVRQSVIRQYDEELALRVTDPRTAAEVIIMQRLAEDDLSGHVLDSPDVIHLCLPMEHDASRHCVTALGWEDPRVDDGELLWPERFPAEELELLKARLGPFAVAGRLQQCPTPRGGGILRREWWNIWEHSAHPKYSFVLASLDTAMTEKTENDPSGMHVYGVFKDERASANRANVMLAYAWTAHLPLHMPELSEDELREIGVDPLNIKLLDKLATLDKHKLLGLVEKVLLTCLKYKVDRLLIENKTHGQAVAAELKRLWRRAGFVVELVEPLGDKVARAHAVVPMLTDGDVWRPDRPWAEKVETECAQFPKAPHDEHCFVAGTMIATRRGLVPIEQVIVGDQALTPDGWRRVIASGCTGVRRVITRGALTGTVKHPIFSLAVGWTPLDTVSRNFTWLRLSLCGFLRIALLKGSSSTAEFSPAWAAAVATTYPQPQPMPGESLPSACMSRSGRRRITERFQRVVISTTRTTILSIVSLRIWSAWVLVLTGASIRSKVKALRGNLFTSNASGRRPPSGTSLTKAERGIGCMWLKALANHGGSVISSASFAALPSSPGSQAASTALGGASTWPLIGERMKAVLGQRWSDAANVGRSSRQRLAEEPSSAGGNAPIEPCNDAGRLVPVFNLTVAEANCYFANGVLVHNCDCLTMALGWLRRRSVIKLDAEVEYETAQAKIGKRRVKGLYPTCA